MSSNALLGNVQYSVLEPNTFKDANGIGWVLMDGRNIQGSALFILTGMTNIPDGRGVFIRSMNENRELTKGDADGNRSIGQPQLDIYASHNHPMNFNLGIQPGWAGGWGGQGGIHPANSPGDAGWDHHAEPTGGNETRPRNIALYLYIKIN